MHKLAVAFFYTCAFVSIAFAAVVVIGKASAQYGDPVASYHGMVRAAL
jgi:hypothetical protein